MTDAEDADAFQRLYEAGAAQIVSRRIVNDLETPVSAYLKIGRARKNAFLLESVEGGETLGRYSIIGIEPDAIWRADGADAFLNEDALSSPDAFVRDDLAPLESLKKFVDRSRIDLPPAAPPMAAGVFGYFSYDTIRQIERLPNKPPDPLGVDDAIFIRPTVIAVFDNIRLEIFLATPVRPAPTTSAGDALAAANERLNAVEKALAEPHPPPHRSDAGAAPVEMTSNMTAADYCAGVERAKEYIRAGDIFQVVLSQRFSTPFTPPPFELYRALRRTNPSPFLFFLDFGAHALVGSSPEILVRVRGGDVVIRPIAGTRRRGLDPAEDAALAEELLADEKERAEHLMLLDLGRNDVGRSAEIGSVRVTESFTIEKYSHVMHIVSNVVGRLRQGVHPVDAVAAGFPAGTLSGAPKIRAMEIIDELEVAARGPYGGAIGYFSANGEVDTCIALRTAVVKDGVMYAQAGAGVVADSDPVSEQRECEQKARALFAAAEIASDKSAG